MLFFGFLNWLSSVPENLMGAVLKGVRSLMFALDSFIYKLIIDLYNIFSQLCTVRLLSSDVLSALSQRIGYVLGVVMLFYVVIGFIQMLVNPDNFNDKEKGAVSIIRRTIIVIVMIGSANFVFDLLFDLQKSVVQSNIISKLLLPYTISTNINNQTDNSGENSIMDNEQFGGLLSEELLTSFYRMEEFDSSTSADLSTTDDGASIYDSCSVKFNSFRLQIINYHRFELGYVCLNEQINAQFLSTGATSGEDQETFVINFNWLLSPICGAAVVYLLFMYCLSVGVRMIQLMFLEIISPMAFVSYLAPKNDTMFNKWIKIYVSTYVDVFIRIAIINFVFFLISTLFSSDSAWGIETTGLSDSIFVRVVLILALLTFAKKAPDLLKELMPAGASKLGFGLTSPKGMMKTLAGGALLTSAAKRTYGAATVGFGTIQRNARKNLGKLSTSNTAGENFKWIARGTVGAIWSGFGGIRRGVMTTNRGGRKTAVNNAVSATQSKQKMHDLGYGSSIPGLFTQKGRQGAARAVSDSVRGFFGRDQYLADMVSESENAIQGIQNRINELQSTYTGWAIQPSKVHKGQYTLTREDGSRYVENGQEFFDISKIREIANQYNWDNEVEAGLTIASLYSQLGKAKGQNKALTQKQQEMDSKKS